VDPGPRRLAARLNKPLPDPMSRKLRPARLSVCSMFWSEVTASDLIVIEGLQKPRPVLTELETLAGSNFCCVLSHAEGPHDVLDHARRQAPRRGFDCRIHFMELERR